MKKRVLSILLVLVMLLGILPAAVMADSTTADPGVVFTKELIEGTANQPAKIRLEAYTTGAVTSSTAKIPADIVLVLDQSGSMDESMGNRTKLAVMKEAVETFVSDVARMNDDAGSLYRVAVVGFASQSGYNDNTEILTALDEREVTSYSYQEIANKSAMDRDETYYIRLYGSYSSITYRGSGNNAGWYTRTGRNPINLNNYTIYERVATTTTETSTGVVYNDLESKHYASALVNCTDGTDGTIAANGIIGQAIAELDGNGATRTDLGMEMAQKIFAAQPAGTYTNRNKIVVLITDGVPTTESSFSATVANAAVDYAKEMKDGGAKIFSMYMGTPSANSANFLQACSSNYPNATAYNNRGQQAANSYYSAYTDASAINAMFSGIASSIVANSTLNEQSVVQDILTENFQLAADVSLVGTRQIEVYTVDKTSGGWEMRAGAEVEVPFANARVTIGGADNKTISVTGFNFGAHCVTDAPKDGQSGSDYGRKLVIYIPIAEDPDADTFGGWVETNAGAYIYQKAGDTQPVITANPARDGVSIHYSLTAAERAFHVDDTQLDQPVNFTFRIGDIAAGILDEMITKIPDGYNNAGVNMEYRLWYIGDKEMSESDTSTDGTSDDELVAELTAPVAAGTAVDVTDPDNWTLKTTPEVEVTIPANKYMAERVYVLVCKLTSTEPVAKPDSLTVYAYLDLSVVRGTLAHLVYGEIDAGGKTTVSPAGQGRLLGNTYTEAVTTDNDSATMTFTPNPGYQISKITYLSSTTNPYDTPTVIYTTSGTAGTVEGVSVELAQDGSWSFQAKNVQSGVAVEVETERIYHTLTTAADDGSEIITGMRYAHEDATMNVPFQALPGYELTKLVVNGTEYNLKTDAVPANVAVLTMDGNAVVGGHAIVSRTQDNNVAITSAARSYNVTLVYLMEVADGSMTQLDDMQEGPTAVVYGTKIADTEAPAYKPGNERTINNLNYTLSDWYTAANRVIDFDTAVMPAEDLTVYALWTRNPDVKVANVTIEKNVVGTHTEATDFNFVAVFHEQVEGTAKITVPEESAAAVTANMEIVMTDRQADLFYAGNGYVYIYELIPDSADGWIYDETQYELRWIDVNGQGSAVLFCDGEPVLDQVAVFTNERSRSAVELSKETDMTTAKVGDTITYTITVKNTGNVALTDVVITDSLSGILFINTNNVTYANGAFTVKALAVGATETIDYTYTVVEEDAGNTIHNEVTVNVNDDTDDDDETETKIENPSVELTKTADKTEAKVGDTITYTVSVENTGNVALENLEITDSLSGIVFTDTDNVTYAGGAFTVKALGETETVTFSYTYVVKTSDEGKNLINTIVALDEEEEVIIPVGEEVRGISVEKEPYAVNGKTTNNFKVNPGDVVTWAITVKNTGDVKLENVSVSDLLTVGDKEHTLIVYNAMGDNAAAVAVIDLNVNQEVTFYANYKAAAEDAGKVLSNRVTVIGNDHDDDPTNDPTDFDTNEDAKVDRPGGPLPSLNKQDHVAYIIGYDDDTVRPENNITRAEVATIFFRLLTDDSRSYYWSQTNSFSDVSKEQWFNNAISTMANAGIVNGYPDGTFRPNAPITRAEFAAIAARFSDVIYDGKSGFSDVLATHWAYDEIALAQHLGWINGYPDNTFRPDKYITRAEAMTLINRVLERAVEEEHMLPDMITWVDNRPSEWYYEAVQEATNSHTYVRTGKLVPRQGFYYEDWIVIVTPPNWAALEKTWSKA